MPISRLFLWRGCLAFFAIGSPACSQGQPGAIAAHTTPLSPNETPVGHTTPLSPPKKPVVDTTNPEGAQAHTLSLAPPLLAPKAPFPRDVEWVRTQGGWGSSPRNNEGQNECHLARAATPTCLDTLKGIQGERAAKERLIHAVLMGDVTGALEGAFHPSESVRLAVALLTAPLITPSISRVVHGLMTHPKPQVASVGLELAGRSQLNMFLPELSAAARGNQKEHREGALRGLASLKTLGGQALYNDLKGPDEKLQTVREVLSQEVLLRFCSPQPKDARVGSTYTVSGWARAVYRLPDVEMGRDGAFTPPLLSFAHRAGVHARRGETDLLIRDIRLFEEALRIPGNCAIHPCDALLLQEMKTSLLSLSGQNR